MLRSLVGSEMCIRDRTTATREKDCKRKATSIEIEKARKHNSMPSAKLKSCQRSPEIRNEQNTFARIFVFKDAVKSGPYYVCCIAIVAFIEKMSNYLIVINMILSFHIFLPQLIVMIQIITYV